MDAAAHVETKARAAKEAARVLALASTRAKNEALAQMARGLEEKHRRDPRRQPRTTSSARGRPGTPGPSWTA